MYQDHLPQDQLLVPQTEEQFDLLIDELCKRYNLGDKTHVAVVVANTIQRMPPDECFTTFEKLRNLILKSVGYSVALFKSRKLSEAAKVQYFEAILKENPYDQASLDALEAMSKEGSEHAREILSLYRPEDAGDNVVKMNPLIDETKGPVL